MNIIKSIIQQHVVNNCAFEEAHSDSHEDKIFEKGKIEIGRPGRGLPYNVRSLTWEI
jgi:hypothetical protein